MDAELAARLANGAPLTQAEVATLRAFVTRSLADCCDECRDVLADQLRREEWREVR